MLGLAGVLASLWSSPEGGRHANKYRGHHGALSSATPERKNPPSLAARGFHGLPRMPRDFQLVPEVGIEPTCLCRRRILSPLRLPFRHSGTLSAGEETAGKRQVVNYPDFRGQLQQVGKKTALQKSSDYPYPN